MASTSTIYRKEERSVGKRYSLLPRKDFWLPNSGALAILKKLKIILEIVSDQYHSHAKS
jgi:hypothetical protein